MSITASQENERTLAQLMGISESDAATRLQQRVAITHGGNVGGLFAEELAEQLGRTIDVVIDDSDCDLEVVIDASPLRQAEKRVFVNLNDEYISVSKENARSDREPANIHGLHIVIGACYAAGVVLSELIEGLEISPRTDAFVVRFDALGVSRALLERKIKLNDTALIGAGAIGNGFLRAARHLNISGQLSIIDPKAVGSGNPNRCLYFNDGDVGKPKAVVLRDRAQPDFLELEIESVVNNFAAFVKSKGRVKRVIVAADSRRVRRSIQKDLPIEVLDASTTEAREIIVHSHRQPNAGACLACIYRHIPDEFSRERDIASGLGIDLSEVTSGNLIDARVAEQISRKHPQIDSSSIVGTAYDSLFKQLCSEQALLSSTGAQVFAPFAFVSNLAGALLALELVRFNSGMGYTKDANYFFLSPWAPPNSRLRTYRAREANCEFCGRPEVEQTLAAVWPEYLRNPV